MLNYLFHFLCSFRASTSAGSLYIYIIYIYIVRRILFVHASVLIGNCSTRLTACRHATHRFVPATLYNHKCWSIARALAQTAKRIYAHNTTREHIHTLHTSVMGTVCHSSCLNCTDANITMMPFKKCLLNFERQIKNLLLLKL